MDKEIYKKHWKKWVEKNHGKEFATEPEGDLQHVYDAMNEYALIVAKQAVEDLQDRGNKTGLNHILNAVARELLYRIKQQTGAK